ncbi:two-component system response regulator BtsR [Azospirillum thermophilum]|uniref:Two-component system response regulator YehT n=1 Tax=Azospirillum thermophilum TaxID=2202148 RepID=A0A2S2CYB7_9PROT|nr:two-component system response regulator BtsR [Azospirillum thermophilum]AWK89458.1 two-component system response regulator YehT [Azospirillum thermophilum]
MINVLIVDDEPLARKELRRVLSKAEDIAIIGECSNAIDAVGMINREKPDVVFLDIQMPRVSGIEMLSMLDHEKMPHIVFLTAYDEYAVQAFEQHAFDYLLKPVNQARLDKTLQRLRRDREPQKIGLLPGANQLRQIPCFGQHHVQLLRMEEVEYVASGISGVYVVATDGSEKPTALPLHILQDRTPLLRCHRQYLVNVDYIEKINFLENGLAEIHTRRGHVIPVSRRFFPQIKERLGIL